MKKYLLLIVMSIVFFTTTEIKAQATETLMSDGNMFLQNGAFDQAISRFRKVLGRDPGNFEAQFNIAFAYLSWGRYSSSATEFKKAASINPRSTEVWSNLAMAYEYMGKSQKALQALYKAVQYNPSNIQARVNLATVYANKNQLNNAIREYKGVIEIDGSNLDAYLNLSKCLISLKKYSDAVRYLKSAISVAPSDPEAYWELGNALWNRDKDTISAIKNYKKAIKLKPNSEIYYHNLAMLYEGMNKKEEALKVWKESLIYIDDALKKEAVQSRIEMLEKGESPLGVATPEELFGSNTRMTATEKIIREGDEVKSEPVKTINTEGNDVGSDMDDLFGDSKDESKSSFDPSIIK